jgi:glycosyltransferase involved in cell wall biosynthesis
MASRVSARVVQSSLPDPARSVGGRPLRVTFVAPFGFASKTTVWARTLPMAQALAARGHRITLVVPPWDSPADAGRNERREGVEIRQVEIDGGLPAILARTLAATKASQPDLVHIVKPRAYAGLSQWWLWQARRVRGQGARLVLDVDDWEQAWDVVNGVPGMMRRFLAWQEEWGIRHADGVSAASRWLAERVQRAAGQMPVVYVPNGVPGTSMQNDWQPRTNADAARRILFVSRFVEVEAEWLAKLWTSLRERVRTAELLIGGKAVNSALEANFKARLEAFTGGRLEGVRWLGYVEREEFERLPASVDCAIFPASDTPLHQAKCSVRLATTLLRGVPVVASAVGEQAQYGAEGAARLVPAEASPEEFAGAVADVLADPAQAAALSVRARRRLLERYDWARLVEPLEALYWRLVGEAEPRQRM